MLQRAASNAYSWWWASHIRTKQSKWLEQNLQDMEEKVGYTLKLIEEDGDSFAKRAEMYYKKRPELINFVKESYHAYRALAERYDHISTELQNANNTLAAVCPEQFQFEIEDDDEYKPPRTQRRPPQNATANIPKVPNMPRKDLKGAVTSATKKLQQSNSKKRTTIAKVAKSAMSKHEGLEEIDKLQKQILALQTEKEFVNSSYESWIAKHWEIEDQINDLQQKVCNLQDEFGEGRVIEDEEARTLMASVALKSCQDTLARMQQKQEKSAQEANLERNRIKDAQEKLDSLKDELLGNEASQKRLDANEDFVKAVEETESSDQDVVNATKEREDLELSREKIKEKLEDGSNASLNVIEMAEKIDEVVNKVVSLETTFSSQTSLVQRLRTETKELQEQIRSLEDDKMALINDKNNLNSKLMEMEEKLCRLQDLNQSFEDKNKSLQKQFHEARCNLDHLSEKLQNVKPDEELEHSSEKEEKAPAHVKFQKENEGQEAALNPNDDVKELQSVKLSEEIEGRETALNHDDDLKEKQCVNPSNELEVKNSSEEKRSPSKVQFEKGIVGLEGVTNLADKKLHSEGPDEEIKLSHSPQNEEKSVVEALSKEESKEQDEKLHHGEIPEKAGGVQTEVVDDVCLSATPGNQGEAVIHDQANEPDKILEKSRKQIIEDKVDKRASSEKPDNFLNVERQEQMTEKEFEPDWKQMFLNGLENREKTILAEYTTVLRNYKELKKKLDEDDMKNGHSNYETALELQELRSANVNKDQEIRSLRQKLSILQAALGEYNDSSEQYAEQKVTVIDTPRTKPTNTRVDISVIREEPPQTTSEIEEKLRTNIDELLEENLDFWLRFSTSFHQIQKFETEVKDLQSEVSKLEEKQKKHEGSSSAKYSLRSDGRPLYMHLKEIETELTLWMEKCALLKEELKSRFSSLCNIQEEITNSLKMSAEDDEFNFTSYQAAKFQGEVLNMKQENNKVADELQAGLDHVTNLLLEVEKTLNLLSEKFGLSESKSYPKDPLQHSISRTRVPLQSFIFGVKPKKQRSSFFSCVHPSLARKYNGFMANR